MRNNAIEFLKKERKIFMATKDKIFKTKKNI